MQGAQRDRRPKPLRVAARRIEAQTVPETRLAGPCSATASIRPPPGTTRTPPARSCRSSATCSSGAPPSRNDTGRRRNRSRRCSPLVRRGTRRTCRSCPSSREGFRAPGTRRRAFEGRIGCPARNRLGCANHQVRTSSPGMRYLRSLSCRAPRTLIGNNRNPASRNSRNRREIGTSRRLCTFEGRTPDRTGRRSGCPRPRRLDHSPRHRSRRRSPPRRTGCRRLAFWSPCYCIESPSAPGSVLGLALPVAALRCPAAMIRACSTGHGDGAAATLFSSNWYVCPAEGTSFNTR